MLTPMQVIKRVKFTLLENVYFDQKIGGSDGDEAK